jgi:hypothetical protein
MSTIFDAAASVNRMNAISGRFYQSQIAMTQALADAARPQIGQALAEIRQSQIALTQALADAARPQIASLSQALAEVARQLPPSLLVQEDLASNPLSLSLATKTSNKRLQKLSDREIAVMLTVTAFMVTYFSLCLLVKFSAQVDEIVSTDGPSPFDAAMAIGALVFWLRMNYSDRSGDK